uniref:Myeloid leukemia factor n=1 Tax=Ascaris suum TaxID=6253 RepID=F1KS59_ASCSU
MFGGDPFGNIFGDIHQQMRRQMGRDMDRMMESMMDPFGMLSRHSMYAGMLEDANPRQWVPHRDDMALMSPFGGFGGGLFGGVMRQMEDLQSVAMNDPNSHVFTQSTMITFDGRNGGQPRIVEKSVRKTGDVKETRESLRHGDIGERMSIEHTIGDRTHVIEKKRDRDGRIREQQRFVNLGEDQAEDFDREFTTRARRNFGAEPVRLRQAITGNPRSASATGIRSNTANSGARSQSVNAPNAPIVTLPDEECDDDNDDSSHSRSSRMHGGSRSQSGGPIIREISEEEAEMSVPKRRKGLVGRFFKANDE